MTDMIAWLRAQLDEDEHEVRVDWRLGDVEWALPQCADRDHLLADIAAKRAILDEIVAQNLGVYGEPSIALPPEWERVLRLLAYAYRHRPGYLPEWAPEGAGQ